MLINFSTDELADEPGLILRQWCKSENRRTILIREITTPLRVDLSQCCASFKPVHRVYCRFRGRHLSRPSKFKIKYGFDAGELTNEGLGCRLARAMGRSRSSCIQIAPKSVNEYGNEARLPNALFGSRASRRLLQDTDPESPNLPVVRGHQKYQPTRDLVPVSDRWPNPLWFLLVARHVSDVPVGIGVRGGQSPPLGFANRPYSSFPDFRFQEPRLTKGAPCK